MNFKKLITALQLLLLLLFLVGCSFLQTTGTILSKIPEYSHNRTSKSITADWENRSADARYDWYYYDFTANGKDADATDAKFKILIGSDIDNFINNQTKQVVTAEAPVGNSITWNYTSENLQAARKYGIIVRSTTDTSNWSVYTFDIK